eukprot:2860675-Prymnesium_polylepis.1
MSRCTRSLACTKSSATASCASNSAARASVRGGDGGFSVSSRLPPAQYSIRMLTSQRPKSSRSICTPAASTSDGWRSLSIRSASSRMARRVSSSDGTRICFSAHSVSSERRCMRMTLPEAPSPSRRSF